MTIYDEKRRFTDAKEGISYRHRFWVGVTEQNTKEGQAAVAARIKGIFEDLKESHVFKDVFLFPQRYSRCEGHRTRDYRKQRWSRRMDYTYRAFIAEENAIQIVEQEIEKWNK